MDKEDEERGGRRIPEDRGLPTEGTKKDKIDQWRRSGKQKDRKEALKKNREQSKKKEKKSIGRKERDEEVLKEEREMLYYKRQNRKGSKNGSKNMEKFQNGSEYDKYNEDNQIFKSCRECKEFYEMSDTAGMAIKYGEEIKDLRVEDLYGDTKEARRRLNTWIVSIEKCGFQYELLKMQLVGLTLERELRELAEVDTTEKRWCYTTPWAEVKRKLLKIVDVRGGFYRKCPGI